MKKNSFNLYYWIEKEKEGKEGEIFFSLFPVQEREGTSALSVFVFFL
jgi:hypothetical protein